MSGPVPPPARRALGKAVALLAFVFVAGVLTGVGGGMFFLRQQVREALTAPAGAPGPVDRLFVQLESDLAREAGLTPPERAALHERLQALAVRMKDSRARFAGELRAAVRAEVETVAARVEPTRRERVREYVRRRSERWGLERAAPLRTPTPGPVEKL